MAFGFFVSGGVQAWIPCQRIESSLGSDGPGPLARATALGAASSSRSYAANAIAKRLFQKGASARSALAFQLASTNLVWELGFVLWVLIGWQFTPAEYAGGLVMIALMAVLLRRFVPAWSGGLSFAGALAFIFADLVILPIVAIYRKYYGGALPRGSWHCCWSR